MFEALKLHWEWVKKSWTMWTGALLLAAPDLLAFLPSVRDQLPETLYDVTFKVVVALFIILRIKTQVKQ